ERVVDGDRSAPGWIHVYVTHGKGHVHRGSGVLRANVEGHVVAGIRFDVIRGEQRGTPGAGNAIAPVEGIGPGRRATAGGLPLVVGEAADPDGEAVGPPDRFGVNGGCAG